MRVLHYIRLPLKTFCFSVFFLLLTLTVVAQKKVSIADSLAITKVLFEQQADWNRGAIDAFMDGYFKSEQLVFSGASGPIYGWEATRQRYHNTYSNRTLMGTLEFKVLDFLALSPKVIQMQGSYHLTRTIGDSAGYFTLIWLKVKKQWRIISDHTSALP